MYTLAHDRSSWFLSSDSLKLIYRSYWAGCSQRQGAVCEWERRPLHLPPRSPPQSPTHSGWRQLKDIYGNNRRAEWGGDNITHCARTHAINVYIWEHACTPLLLHVVICLILAQYTISGVVDIAHNYATIYVYNRTSCLYYFNMLALHGLKTLALKHEKQARDVWTYMYFSQQDMIIYIFMLYSHSLSLAYRTAQIQSSLIFSDGNR